MTNPESHRNRYKGYSSTVWKNLIFDLLFLLVLAAGAYFRTVGTDWDQGQHLHPDERFLTMVEGAIRPVSSLGEYFNTASSTLNPHNVGYTFYVYGTLPLFIIRYVSEWAGQDSYGQLYIIGRQLSALADLLTVLLVYLTAGRLFGRRVAFLAGAFSAFAVLQIQLSHFMTVDTFTNMFTFAAFYFAVRIAFPEGGRDPGVQTADDVTEVNQSLLSLWEFILFGAALGMAMASKVSAAPLALLLPAAAVTYLVRRKFDQPNQQAATLVFYMCVSALTAFLVFRVGQPYAFSGPGFFGLQLNPLWIANLKELSAQALSDVPWALQWARRPLSFAWTNMVTWGLGLPLGLLAWISFLWMGWRILKGEWQRLVLVWAWTLIYFSWQSSNFSRSMRYQLLVYPTLAIIAGWGLVKLWEKARDLRSARRWSGGFAQSAVIALIAVTLGGSLAWAYAFTRIYTVPVTRVQASDWILSNVPGPVNFVLQTASGEKSVPLPYRAGVSFSQSQPYVQIFRPQTTGMLTAITITNLWDGFSDPKVKNLIVQLSELSNPSEVIGSAVISDPFVYIASGSSYKAQFLIPPGLDTSKDYLLQITLDDPLASMSLNGQASLTISSENGQTISQPLAPAVQRITGSSYYQADYVVAESGWLKQVNFPHLVDLSGTPGEKTLELTISNIDPASLTSSSASVRSDFLPKTDVRGDGYTFILDQPLEIKAGSLYSLSIELVDGYGEVAVYGSWPVNESTFDDALPLYGSGYAAYGDSSYIYRGDLKFESYWPDNVEKSLRYQSVLNEADYIFISSNRQWGTTVRVPERYPLTTLFYRELIGCPAEKDILWCYSTAKPGMFFERLGYKLIAVFQSNPRLGSIEFNDQLAEEAFTVYDHPKVLIFKKQSSYDPEAVARVLNTVDYSMVLNLLPHEFKSQSENLMLPPERWSIQQNGGTWSTLFDVEAWYNRYPGLGAVLWYLVVALLGWIVYPLIRLALPGLPDHGYPLARTAGLVILAFLVWIGGSVGWRVERVMITQVMLILVVVCAGLAYIQRADLGRELRKRSKYILLVEAVALAFFTIDLVIRIGNPDLWHPAYGGEKPMDFSYFNAVLKSSTFPPYDPWFAGGYINYYYYGYVVAGVLVKWLGITPSIAYNLILPTFFSLLALGAFSAAWNLLAHHRKNDPLVEDEDELSGGLGLNAYNRANLVDGPVLGHGSGGSPVDAPGPHAVEADAEVEEDLDEESERAAPFKRILQYPPFWIGLAAAAGVVLLGNLGTLRMIWTGLQRLAAPNGVIEGAGILTRLGWSARGIMSYISGANLPYGLADWYWKPSRAIQPEAGNEITEFPFFTFLYGDMHAHLLALPITLLLMGCLLSIVMNGSRWDRTPAWIRHLSIGAEIFLTALVLGALRPTNTWDFYTYLILTASAVAYAGLVTRTQTSILTHWWDEIFNRVVRTGLFLAAIIGLSLLLYKPFTDWYLQAYNAFTLWKGDRTIIWSYLTHWGLFLFLIASWMFAETRQWLASTPMSRLLRLKPYARVFQAAAAIIIIAAIGLTLTGIRIGWLVVLLGAWAVVLIARPGQSTAKRIVLFLFGSGLVLTLFVEVFVLKGDIGRMNTVFKFYLQVWIFFAISAAAGLFWFLEAVESWKPRWAPIWSVFLAVLVLGAALYPMTAGLAKIRDRMVADAPQTLDGAAFMASASYAETWGTMNLAEDYRAIQWLQENVPGSAVIVEANNRNLYRWGSRMTIYTGLPGVVGWEWHQQQQRAVMPGSVVTNRILEIENFYRTTDPEAARAFLAKYNVGYIILGQQERGMYSGPGLDKFEENEGILWQEVYRDGNTVIYQSACKCGAD